MPYLLDGFGVRFPLQPATGIAAVQVRLLTRLRTLLGEWPTDTRIGLPWLSWLETGYVDPSEAEALIRAQLEGDPAVVSVEGVTMQQDGEALGIAAGVQVSVDGVTSALLLVVGPDPYATRAAPPWYLASGALRFTRRAAWGG